MIQSCDEKQAHLWGSLGAARSSSRAETGLNWHDSRCRDDQSVMLTKTRQVTVRSTRDVLLFLDGERVNVGKKKEISFVPKAVNVIIATDRTR